MKSVLLADDDIDDREMFEEILADSQEVSLAGSVENGQELLSLLFNLDPWSLPDLIVLDHNMPKLNGIQKMKSTGTFR